MTALALGLCLIAAAPRPISQEQFIRAYVLCNNRAWAGSSHELIPFIRNASAQQAATRSPAVRGFIELGYLWGDRQLAQPDAPATIGWAAATKAYADDGGIEPRFRTPAAARSYLAQALGHGVRGLNARETASLATNLHLARLARDPGKWTLAGVSQSLESALDEGTARRLLREIGSHESVGSARVGPLVVRRCRESDILAFLKSQS